MPQSSQEQRAALLAELARELQQLNGLSASFFRAAAARIGVTVTDMQVIESLASTGPMTAGQLAELTGLTTGAITGMLNRLEEAGLVRRERDPEDGRRVIVRLAPDTDQIRNIGPIFDVINKAWEEQTAHYDDEQIAFLVDFLKRSNAVARQELAWLREGPQNEEGVYSAPLGDRASSQLVASGVPELTLRAVGDTADLYQARFQGPAPEVKTTGGVVSIRYPRRLWPLDREKRTAAVLLNASIPWQIKVTGGGAVVNAELGGLDLAGLEITGGGSMISVDLPMPSGVVPVRISGGASIIKIQRPEAAAARVHLKGRASIATFDDQKVSNLGSDMWLQSPDYQGADQRYDIEVGSSASMVTITTD